MPTRFARLAGYITLPSNTLAAKQRRLGESIGIVERDPTQRARLGKTGPSVFPIALGAEQMRHLDSER